MIDKNIITKNYINKLKKIINVCIKRNRLNEAMAAISVAGNYLYQFNQYYTDEELENYISVIAQKLKNNSKIQTFKKNTDKILVYDGFALDTRGVILMYLNALGLNGYSVVYITNNKFKNNIPTITSMCKKYNFDMEFIEMNNYKMWTLELIDIFQKYCPKSAFFYTLPNDVSAAVAFNIFDGVVDRYLIDLTDHAFWIGKISMDYFLGSRDMSAYLEHYQRNIPKNKCIKLGVNLLIEKVEDHSNLPFKPEETRYIFSGGSLYKTLGDENNTYYKIVDYILSNHDVKFLYAGYAGFGEDSEMIKILNKFPQKAFLIEERKDYFYLIENCIFYLNTYPMFGGMMMKYCALAKKLPLTLVHNSDSDGLLLNQKKCDIEYKNYEELIEDIDLLIKDENYLKAREKKLEGSIITEERFKNNIRSLLENHCTDYKHEFIELDTKQFREEYYNRFNCKKAILEIVEKKNLGLFFYFPVIFTYGILKKIIIKLSRRN